MLRHSRPWRPPLQARDLRDETPWAAPPLSCLPCSLPSLPPCVTAHHAPSLPRPRNRLVASGVGGLTRPSLGAGQGTRIAMLRNEPKSSPIWRRADAIRRRPETRTTALGGTVASIAQERAGRPRRALRVEPSGWVSSTASEDGTPQQGARET